MKTLFFGAGPLGSLYAHLFWQAGHDVTILARGERCQFILENGLVLIDEFQGSKQVSRIRVIDKIEEPFDLVVVLVRRNKIGGVIEALAPHQEHLKNVLFMGNNVTGFEDYLSTIPSDKILFGFPAAGGTIEDNIVHYVDAEKPGGKRLPITIGEIDGVYRDRTRYIQAIFESSGVPVHLTRDMDGWLKYHAAFVLPIALALYRHHCDTYAMSEDWSIINMVVKACKEGGDVLHQLGYHHRQPFKFNWFYWFPEWLNATFLKKFFDSKFAEVALSLHAKSAMDEMAALSEQFQLLIQRSGLPAPHFEMLASVMQSAEMATTQVPEEY